MPPEPHDFFHLTDRISLYRCSTGPNRREGLLRPLSPESTMAYVSSKKFLELGERVVRECNEKHSGGKDGDGKGV